MKKFKKPIEKLIFQKCWNLFESFNSDNSNIICTKTTPNNYTSLTYERDGQLISRTDAKTLLQKLILDSINQHNKVYLYTMPDEQFIQIEPRPNELTDGELDLYEQEDLTYPYSNKLNTTLFIAKD